VESSLIGTNELVVQKLVGGDVSDECKNVVERQHKKVDAADGSANDRPGAGRFVRNL